MAAYDVVAPFYDRIMDDPGPRAARVVEAVDQFRPGATSLLELGCGTGALLSRLDPALDRWGLDASPAMLRRAAAAAPGAHLVEGDMADFALGRTFDVVACIFDSLNHLLTVEAWRSCLGAVRRHLVPGGLFVLDVNTVGELRRIGDDPPEVYDFDGGVSLVEVTAATAPDGGIASVWDIRVFEQVGDGPSVDGATFRLHRERIGELALPLRQVVALLGEGFDVLEATSETGAPATDEAVKAYLACRRR